MHRTKDVILRYFCTYRADKIPLYTEQNPVLQLQNEVILLIKA